MTTIEWYEGVCRDESFNDVGTLMMKRGQLAAASVDLAKKIKDGMVMHRRAEFTTDIRLKRRVIELTAETDDATGRAYSAVKSQAIAETENEDTLAYLSEMEGVIEGDKLILKQIGRVLDAMQQHIAELRNERNNG